MSKSLEDRMSYKEMYLMYKNQCEEQKDYILKLEKENQELIVNKNVAQAVAFDQKREIAELKDQVAYLKEEFEGWQSACEWAEAKNAILKSENEELKEKYNQSFKNFLLMNDEYSKLKKAIEILENKCVSNTNLWLVVCSRNYEDYKSFVENKDHELVRIEHNILTQEEYDLLKEVLS